MVSKNSSKPAYQATPITGVICPAATCVPLETKHPPVRFFCVNFYATLPLRCFNRGQNDVSALMHFNLFVNLQYRIFNWAYVTDRVTILVSALCDRLAISSDCVIGRFCLIE